MEPGWLGGPARRRTHSRGAVEAIRSGCRAPDTNGAQLHDNHAAFEIVETVARKETAQRGRDERRARLRDADDYNPSVRPRSVARDVAHLDVKRYQRSSILPSPHRDQIVCGATEAFASDGLNIMPVVLEQGSQRRRTRAQR